MSENITYLLGAGASANCLPVVSTLPSKLEEFKKLLEVRIDPYSTDRLRFQQSSIIDHAKNLIKDINRVLRELGRHSTIDTLAKKYFLTGKDTELNILKTVLIVYFFFEQTYAGNQKKQLPDKRYDSLIATIVEKSENELRLPGNYKIITWNYDCQFEYACLEYFRSSNISQIQARIQAVPTIEALTTDVEIDLSKFALVRLNGVAHINNNIGPLFYRGDTIYNNDSVLYDELETGYLQQIVNYYDDMTNPTHKLFRYAWEGHELTYKIGNEKFTPNDIAQQIMEQTTILVVIGYSFPLFNRGIDKELFKVCKTNLKKVYVQDLNANEIEHLLISVFPVLQEYKAFNSIFINTPSGEPQRKVPIEAFSSVGQFFIPPEADI